MEETAPETTPRETTMTKHRFGIARSIRVYDIFETDDPALLSLATDLDGDEPESDDPNLTAILDAIDADEVTFVRRDLGEEADEADYIVFISEY